VKRHCRVNVCSLPAGVQGAQDSQQVNAGNGKPDGPKVGAGALIKYIHQRELDEQ
jgi:hypothetical protein